MKIIDIFRDSTIYHIRCSCGFDFNHIIPSDGWEVECPVCSKKQALRELLQELEEATKQQ